MIHNEIRPFTSPQEARSRPPAPSYALGSASLSLRSVAQNDGASVPSIRQVPVGNSPTTEHSMIEESSSVENLRATHRSTDRGWHWTTATSGPIRAALSISVA